MKPLPDGTFRYSPHDLVAYLDGDFAAWCERMLAERGRAGGAGPDLLQWATPDEGDEEAALAKRKGDEHEQRYLARLRERYPTLVALDRDDPDGLARTLAAMAAGEPVIYQGHLIADGWGATPTSSSAARVATAVSGWHYTPWDTKLARSAKPAFLVQLCAYADMLEALRGYLPTELVFVFGQGEERPYRTHQYYHYYRQLRRAFTAFQDGWSADRRPEPGTGQELGALGEGRRGAAGAVRSPEPRRQHHPRAGAPAGECRDHHADRARRVRARPPGVEGVGPGVRAAPGAGEAPAGVARPARARSGSHRPRDPERAAPRSRACCPRPPTATCSSTWKASPTPKAGWSTSSAR